MQAVITIQKFETSNKYMAAVDCKCPNLHDFKSGWTGYPMPNPALALVDARAHLEECEGFDTE